MLRVRRQLLRQIDAAWQHIEVVRRVEDDVLRTRLRSQIGREIEGHVGVPVRLIGLDAVGLNGNRTAENAHSEPGRLAVGAEARGRRHHRRRPAQHVDVRRLYRNRVVVEVGVDAAVINGDRGTRRRGNVDGRCHLSRLHAHRGRRSETGSSRIEQRIHRPRRRNHGAAAIGAAAAVRVSAVGVHRITPGAADIGVRRHGVDINEILTRRNPVDPVCAIGIGHAAHRTRPAANRYHRRQVHALPIRRDSSRRREFHSILG